MNTLLKNINPIHIAEGHEDILIFLNRSYLICSNHLITNSLTAGVCMLLLVSNLLFWENVAAKPTGGVSIEDMYNRLVEQTHGTYYMAADIYQEFVSKVFASRVLSKSSFK